MANSGGGTLVYGVQEQQKRATARRDVGGVDETYERALRSAAITAISPPLFGLEIHQVGEPGSRALVLVVPATEDGPHLVYRGEYFGAPIRNNADTVWMKERQIEAMYRARLDGRRHATEALGNLYNEAAAGRDTEQRAWFIGVARPRLPVIAAGQPSSDDARMLFESAGSHAVFYAGRGGIHPLDNVDRSNPRPGLRRWIAVNNAASDSSRWREAWAAVHHDGAASVAAAIGGHRTRSGRDHHSGERVDSSAIECAVADLMGLLRALGEHMGTNEYDLRVGVEWAGGPPLVIQTVDSQGFECDGSSTPLVRFTPVTVSVQATAAGLDFYWQVHDLAQDCVNQGGIANVQMIHPPDPDTRPAK